MLVDSEMACSRNDVTIAGAQHAAYAEILTPEAIEFVAALARRFQPSLEQLLAKRVRVQAAYDSGEQKLDFNPHTQHIREKEWKVRHVSCHHAYHPHTSSSSAAIFVRSDIQLHQVAPADFMFIFL